ncbi:DNA/RNA non-specific endonuclease [Lactobacillus sp. ESL0684]|uniref:DNA/RNA non-specific endonuclease n=1 Tax=unclassified Lactobacillus TaxID=2620435 RepID=UPI0023F8E766|nr:MULTISPECIES: DNA/RNA non-specific endonuclease [unclassified Lactobacillus]WEV41192.1 DNA/RNA non-specific endonuclease [Lactobacillus sp. ESL0681]WEV43985.1 DNA/RNA non-specific endonuclease [Lactobacillus sp. ESL0684]
MARKKRRRSKRKDNSNFWSVVVIMIAAIWLISTKGGSDPNGSHFLKQFTGQSSTSSKIDHAKPATTAYGGLAQKDYDKLAKLDFKSGGDAYITVNANKSTLIKNAWKVNRVIYADLDSLNRTSHSNTAFLEKRNVASGDLRVRQYVEPTAWHYNHRGKTQVYNRGHLIAYSVSAGIDQSGNYNPDNQSGDQNNPKNLFTQSAFANQKIQTVFESKVRSALRANKRVIYQATPIFRGQELMARGINLQAVATDGSLDFNVYLFNVQPGFVFNYQDGRAKVNRELQVNDNG